MATTSKPRARVRLDPAVRRAQILRETARLISDQGFNAVSLADIADACEIRKQAVLHYFPSREHLLQAVLEGFTAAEAAAAALPAADQTETRAFFTAMVQRALGQREIIRLYFVLGAEALSERHPAHSFFAGRSAQSRADVAALLSWQPDPGVAAVELLAFWQGLIAERDGPPTRPDRKILFF